MTIKPGRRRGRSHSVRSVPTGRGMRRLQGRRKEPPLSPAIRPREEEGSQRICSGMLRRREVTAARGGRRTAAYSRQSREEEGLSQSLEPEGPVFRRRHWEEECAVTFPIAKGGGSDRNPFYLP